MRLLLLGGPKFLGRAVIDHALGAGHEVTLFNRGKTDADLYPELERIVGDRDGGLDGLRGGSWDAVIDTSGYLPRLAAASANVLANSAAHYVFVSSISVYASFADRVDEAAAVATLSDPTSEDIEAEYGALKAACEVEIETCFPGRATHIRAGLIVGPHDPTGRFSYWPHRIAEGGDILVVAPVTRPVQFVDVRDLGSWLVTCAERRVTGTLNATCNWSFSDLLATSMEVTGTSVIAHEVAPAFLSEQAVGEWLELPLWIDERNPEWKHFMQVDTSRAAAEGLVARPLAETVAGTLALADRVDGVGLTRERETELLAAWASFQR